jgi:hypothetical protein
MTNIFTKEELLHAISNGFLTLFDLPPELSNDEEIVMESVRTYKNGLEHASEELKNNKLFLLQANKIDKNAF